MNFLVEGWRGINHSYAMVNHYQLVELLKRKDVSVEHLDVPFAKPTWNATTNNPGFPAEMSRAVMDIPGPSRSRYDITYRIASPFCPSSTTAARHVTFMTSEFALSPVNFASGEDKVARFVDGDDCIVVPSRWSRGKLIEFGFPGDKVHVVSHGVSERLFSPASESERQMLRSTIGLRPGDFAFLNLGAMTWNKGLDILLRAFVEIRRRYPQAVLVLKDDPNLYAIGARTVIVKMVAEAGFDLPPEVNESIKLISTTLPMGSMRLLYGGVDCYVSPYRAEGFNMPVIESIACGTPVIVSQGGATDDFCETATARFIACDKVENAARGIAGKGYHLDPDLGSLIQAMSDAIEHPISASPEFETGRQATMRRLSWEACVDELAGILRMH